MDKVLRHFHNLAITGVNEELKIVFCNAAAEKLLGCKTGKTLDSTSIDLNSPKDMLMHELICALHKSKSGKPFKFNHEEGAGEDYRSLECLVAEMRDENGTLCGYVFLCLDISEREKIGEALQVSEDKYSALVENIDLGVIIVNSDHTIIFANPELGRIFHKSPDRFIGKKCYQEFKKVEEVCKDCPGVRAMQTGRTEYIETECLRDDYGVISVRSRSFPYYDHGGKIIGYMEILEDITEKMIVKKLHESIYRISEAVQSTERLSELYSAVHKIIQNVMPAQNFYIALYDADKDFLSFPYFVDSEDLPPSAKKPGKGMTEYVLRTGKSLLATSEIYLEMATRGEIALLGKPSLVWLGVPLTINEKTIGVMAVQDYSNAGAYGPREQQMLEFVSVQTAKAIEKKKSEEMLRASEEKYRALFENSSDAIFIANLEGRILDINHAGIELLGYDKNELLEIKVHQFFSDLVNFVEFNKELREKGNIKNFETKLIANNGNTIECLITAAIKRNESGAPAYYQGIVNDFTERKHLEKQFLQAQKMEAIGQLAGGIAHDFNNLLTVIIGSSELALRHTDNSDFVCQKINDIYNTSIRAASLVKQLLAFSRKQNLDPKIVNLNHIVANTDKMLRRIIGEDIELVIIPEEGLWNIRIDPGQIEQVILNIAVNARDAMIGGGTFAIETANIELNGSYVRLHPDAQEGPHVMLSFSDTGEGMSREVMEHIFEPFFTTKESGKGTGLGLSTVYGIVKQSGGAIWAYSETGRGTTFKLYFPKAEGKSPASERHSMAEILPRGNETTLVVEDDVSLRAFAANILTELGYKVLEAADGVEAFSLAKGLNKPIDLLITDVVMPNMGGPELIRKLNSELWPKFNALLISGYPDRAFSRNNEIDPALPYLQKPFTPIVFARKIREILDSG